MARVHLESMQLYVQCLWALNKDYDKIDQGDNIEISKVRENIQTGGKLFVKNSTKKIEFEVEYDLSDRQKEIILAGGTLAYMKNKSN